MTCYLDVWDKGKEMTLRTLGHMTDIIVVSINK